MAEKSCLLDPDLAVLIVNPEVNISGKFTYESKMRVVKILRDVQNKTTFGSCTTKDFRIIQDN